jgi:superfamily II DNA/RNA helicase
MLRAAIEAEGEACRNAIIFCNRKVDVDIVAKSLKKHGLNAEAIHGDLDQSHRTRTLDGFRDGSISFLVASDVAARGLDIPNVSHVFNYDVPSHAEDYVHRIGRTGRAGRKGVAITLAVPADGKYLGAIESLIETEIPRVEPPWSPEEKPKRGRGKAKDAGTAEDEAPKRRRTSRKSDRTEDGPAEAAAEAPAEAPRPPEAQDERKPRRERGGKGRSGRRDKGAVVGMGEHLPGFIALSFDERRGGPPRSEEAPGDDTPAATDTPDDTGEAEKPAPKRRRSRSRKSADPDAARDGGEERPADPGGDGTDAEDAA